MQSRRAYPSDVSDEEWALVAPYLTLLPETSSQREHSLREVFNGLRYVVRYGVAWRAMPHDLPPWHAVYDQAQRWLKAGCFENLVHDLRAVLRMALGRAEEPSAVVLDSRTLRSTSESGARAAWDGHKRTRGSKLHAAVDTLGQVLALHVTPANADDRAAVATLADAVQEATGDSVDLAYVDQGYTGERAAKAAADHGIALEVVKLPEAKRGFVLLPRRWVVERAFAWMARFRRLARDYERLPATLAGLHLVAFSVLLLRRAADFAAVRNSLYRARTARRLICQSWVGTCPRRWTWCRGAEVIQIVRYRVSCRGCGRITQRSAAFHVKRGGFARPRLPRVQPGAAP